MTKTTQDSKALSEIVGYHFYLFFFFLMLINPFITEPCNEKIPVYTIAVSDKDVHMLIKLVFFKIVLQTFCSCCLFFFLLERNKEKKFFFLLWCKKSVYSPESNNSCRLQLDNITAFFLPPARLVGSFRLFEFFVFFWLALRTRAFSNQ